VIDFSTDVKIHALKLSIQTFLKGAVHDAGENSETACKYLMIKEVNSTISNSSQNL